MYDLCTNGANVCKSFIVCGSTSCLHSVCVSVRLREVFLVLGEPREPNKTNHIYIFGQPNITRISFGINKVIFYSILFYEGYG